MREQSVPAADVDDAAAAQQAPRASRNFPRFIELFARKTTGVADGTAKAVEQTFAGESAEVISRKPILRRRRKSRGGLVQLVTPFVPMRAHARRFFPGVRKCLQFGLDLDILRPDAL